MSQYADYSNLQNKIVQRKLKWNDEVSGNPLVEATGLAASTKDSLSFMISTIRPINRLIDQSINARGPFNPPVFKNPIKLKSILKGYTDKYQIIQPISNEKVKRPQSCGGVRQRVLSNRNENPFVVTNNNENNINNNSINNNINVNNIEIEQPKKVNNYFDQPKEDKKKMNTTTKDKFLINKPDSNKLFNRRNLTNNFGGYTNTMLSKEKVIKPSHDFSKNPYSMDNTTIKRPSTAPDRP